MEAHVFFFCSSAGNKCSVLIPCETGIDSGQAMHIHSLRDSLTVLTTSTSLSSPLLSLLTMRMGIPLSFGNCTCILCPMMDKNLLKLYLSGTHLVCELYSWVSPYKITTISQWVIVGTFITLSVFINLLREVFIQVSHSRSASLPWLCSKVSLESPSLEVFIGCVHVVLRDRV